MSSTSFSARDRRSRPTGIIVAHSNVVGSSSGGVQVCHREYEATLEAAGYNLDSVLYEYDHSLLSRLKGRVIRKLGPRVSRNLLEKKINSAIEKHNATHIFYALWILPEISERLRLLYPTLTQVLLSHGTEALDFAIEQRIRRSNRGARYFESLTLGKSFFDQMAARSNVDAVLTLSPFEVEIEKWLGARRALWLPRTIMEPTLDVRPINGRVGYVGTLDHPPNADGLTRLLEALRSRVDMTFRFRIVGRPENLGQCLANSYPFVEYAGALTDAELHDEAASWCCFVNPVFANAKGCSTKLATALGWRLPIATTELGARGYLWNESIVPLARSEEELASLVMERASTSTFCEHRAATQQIVEMSPRIDTIGASIRNFLGRDFATLADNENK